GAAVGGGAIVSRPPAFVGEDPVRFGELGGAVGRHRLELLPEMVDLVGMVLGDLRAERPLDLVGRGGRRNFEQLVKALHRFLNSATLAAGSSRRSRDVRSP